MMKHMTVTPDRFVEYYDHATMYRLTKRVEQCVKAMKDNLVEFVRVDKNVELMLKSEELYKEMWAPICRAAQVDQVKAKDEESPLVDTPPPVEHVKLMWPFICSAIGLSGPYGDLISKVRTFPLQLYNRLPSSRINDETARREAQYVIDSPDCKRLLR